MGTNAENTELTVQSKNPITKHNSSHSAYIKITFLDGNI